MDGRGRRPRLASEEKRQPALAGYPGAMASFALHLALLAAAAAALHALLQLSLPAALLLVAGLSLALQAERLRRREAAEIRSFQALRSLLGSQESTKKESCEWLNKLAQTMWANLVEPSAQRHLRSFVQETLTQRKPSFMRSVQVESFVLGSTCPEVGLDDVQWSVDVNGQSLAENRMQTALYAGFRWRTSDLNVVLAARFGSAAKATAKIVVNRLQMTGNVRLDPAFDGRALLYTFVGMPFVDLGVSIGDRSGQMSIGFDMPLATGWLKHVLVDTLRRQAVLPKRLLLELPAVGASRVAVYGMLNVGVLAVDMEGQTGATGTAASHFVEITLNHTVQRAKPKANPSPANPVEALPFELEGCTGVLEVKVYEQLGTSTGAKVVGSSSFQVQHGGTQGTYVWTIGKDDKLESAYAEYCGQEVHLALSVSEWHFLDGSRVTADSSLQLGSLDKSSIPRRSTGKKITVTVIEGRGILPNGRSQVYLKIIYGKRVRKSKTMSADGSAMWNETFSFLQYSGQLLQLRCYAATDVGDQLLGSAVLDIQAVANDMLDGFWIPIDAGTEAKLFVKVAVHDESSESSQSGILPTMQEVGLNNEHGPILEVVVGEARQNTQAELAHAKKPYVSVRYGNQKQRTRVVDRSTTPQWYQTLQFVDIGASLELHLKDHHSLRKAHELGHCIIDYQSLPQGQAHDRWVPLIGLHEAELRVQVTRRGSGKMKELPSSLLVKESRPGQHNLQQLTDQLSRASGFIVDIVIGIQTIMLRLQARMLVRKAVVIAQGIGEDELLAALLEDLDRVESEREDVLEELQRDRDLLVAKAKELEEVCRGGSFQSSGAPGERTHIIFTGSTGVSRDEVLVLEIWQSTERFQSGANERPRTVSGVSSE
eukprot:SM000196S05370  [mRNA]  locus=s196:221133:226791:+ [translate_table: standard]